MAFISGNDPHFSQSHNLQEVQRGDRSHLLPLQPLSPSPLPCRATPEGSMKEKALWIPWILRNQG